MRRKLAHRTVAYAITPFPPQPAERTMRDGDTIARFHCPRCQGTTAQLEVEAAPAKGAGPQPALPNLVECQCGQPHAGRPENAPAWGCGGFWNEFDG
ncbi:hypothetical protein ACQRWP_06745 [Micromonospora trifolii]|uniref:hypothetical protein n=1 Tax=Micromonospora trifolii TaxID=2911208 RepID=UPI003D2EBFD7